MKRLVLSLLALIVTIGVAAQDMSRATVILPVWDNQSAPHSNGLAEAGETRNGRPSLTTYTELYVYAPDREKANGRGVVICPGGGYRHLSMENEGAHMAEWFAEQGYVAAVLHYRMPNGHPEVPLEDAERAIRILRGEAEGLQGHHQVPTVGIIGSSAGGHLAAMTSTMGEERPDFAVLFYPVITAEEGKAHRGSFVHLLGEKASKKQLNYYSLQNRVTEQTPPTFLLLPDDDRTVPSVNSTLYYNALKEHGVKASLHIYPVGGHGFGMRESFPYKESWQKLLLDWLDRILQEEDK
ncbi:MAG: alpha/beta hydrolase [Alistipes sp.]|nr:alpha/beta hydrolase [Alistipes sp.]